MSDLHRLTLAEALEQVAAKKVSSREILEAVDAQVQKLNPDLNIYLTLNQDRANEQAARTDLPLAGLPIAVKDNITTKGINTTASSTVLDSFVPQYSATIIKKLAAAGGLMYGKTNLDAWAHGSSTETSQYGTTLNPRNSAYLPGGSSGGSAAAVAADACLAAIGTETAGSIRQPAAWCGLVGLKPTYGRVSRQGIVAMASSTDSPGPMTKTVQDAAILLNHLAGHDPLDGTTSSQPVPDFTQHLDQSIKGLKIGVMYTDLAGIEPILPHLEAATAVLTELGAEVETTDALDPHLAVGVYTVIQRAEVSSNLARFTKVRYGHGRDRFGDEARRRIMLGTYTTAKGYADQYYLTAQKVRSLFLNDFKQLFEKYDLVISLTSPGFAKKLGASEGSAMFGELEDLQLEPSSIVGLPGLSVPCYRNPDTNLFLGLNIMAPMWREDVLIKVGDAFEKNTSWNTWRNP